MGFVSVVQIIISVITETSVFFFEILLHTFGQYCFIIECDRNLCVQLYAETIKMPVVIRVRRLRPCGTKIKICKRNIIEKERKGLKYNELCHLNHIISYERERERERERKIDR